MRKPFLVLCSLALCPLVSHGAVLTADCAVDGGPLDKAKLLNVARGGHGINSDLTWMPSFYDKLVEIGVREFRVDWLLGDAFYKVVSRDASGRLQYDFSKLDQIIVPMAKKGIEPVMCLCYMASALGPEKGEPEKYAEYADVVRQYVRHYKKLGFTGWAWESHNEPEGFTKLTAEQTFRMYREFAAAVKSADPTARVGGYGAVGSDWAGYMHTFLDLYKKDRSRTPMDFFSVHQYGGDDWQQVSFTEKAFEDRGLEVPPILVTEWNNHWGPGSGYDSNVNASYVAMKLNAALSYKNLGGLYYWNFADWERKPDANNSGMFTVDGHRKAAANTFWMFNRLGPALVPVGVSGVSDKRLYGIVTRDTKAGSVAVILWNHQESGAEMTVDLDNLPFKARRRGIRLTKHLVDAAHGNFTGGAPEHAELVESLTLPPLAGFSRTETLPPHSVVLLEFAAGPPWTPPVRGGFHTIVSGNGGKALEVPDGGALDLKSPGSDAQRWKINLTGEGTYQILNVESRKSLSYVKGSPDAGVSELNDGSGQEFIITGSQEKGFRISPLDAVGVELQPGDPDKGISWSESGPPPNAEGPWRFEPIE
jgi:hypothetical protein